MPLPRHYFPQAAVGGDLKTADPYWNDSNYVAEPKLDGCRFLIHKDEQGEVRIYSRHISKQTGLPVLKTAQLQHLADEVDAEFPNGSVIDGEVVAANGSGVSCSNLVTKITGSKVMRAIELQELDGYLQYVVFDCLVFDGVDLTQSPYHQRRRVLDITLPYGTKHITVIESVRTNKRGLYDAVVASGGEGVILKDVNSTYHQGDRHKSWVKVKRQKTFDRIITGFQEAEEFTTKKGQTELTKSRIAGQVGAIKLGVWMPRQTCSTENPMLFEQAPDLELVDAGTVSGFDDAMRLEFTQHPERYIGTVVELTAQEVFKTGRLRHGRFLQLRPDKNAEECVFRPDES
jgi:ATP-dependent DNA ligase